MFLFGTIVNAVLVIIGTIIGVFFKDIRESQKQLILQAMGLVVVVLGISMAMEMKATLLSIISLAIGAVLGDYWNWEGKLEQVGNKLEQKFGKGKRGNVTNAFMTSTLVFCVGAMAILGAIDSGIRNNHDVLLTKSIIDGFCAIIFTSTLGYGVIFSSIPVFLYQGSIAFAAYLLGSNLPQQLLDVLVNGISGVGGILILALGLNVAGITKIKVGNLLPALFIIIILLTGEYYFF
ncbi:MAG: DUF554 domain-containing protein [Bacillaceae bacterium]